MRVTHIITRLIVGGAQENTIASVLGLQHNYAVQVRLLSGPTTGPEGSLEPLLQNEPGLLTLVPELVRPVHPWKDTLALRHLTRLLRHDPPDIVHTHSGKAGILGRFAARAARVPVIVHTIHGPSFGPFQGRLANVVFQQAERAAGRFTTHFVTVAQAMEQQYLAARIGSPQQYTRIWSGFDLNPFLTAQNDPVVRARFGLAPSDFVIGKIARLFERKGHDDLFAVAPAIVAQCPDARFLLVGDGAWRGRFEAKARELGLERHFIFTGLVPPSAIPSLVGVMDVLVHLSEREGLARALPQALAAAKPVIAYNVDGAREVCLDEETGFLLPLKDLDSLQRRILQLANDPARRARLGLRGQALVKDCFPVEKMVADLYALYQRLLSKRASSLH